MKIRYRIISAIAALPLIFSAGAFPRSEAQAISYTQSAADYADAESAGEYVREQLRRRSTDFSFTVTSPYPSGTNAETVFDELGNKVIEAALAETDSGDDGDYIRYALYSYASSCSVSRGVATVRFYDIVYNSTAAQEQAVTKKLAEVTPELSLSGKSDYEKIEAIYGYITDNVVYASDLSDRVVYTPYGALINETAVCQGYSLLLYRMLKEAGINSRIVVGTGNGGNHAWNIAEIDGLYYYLDATWDAAVKKVGYGYFLRGTEDFDSVYPNNSHSLTYSGAGTDPFMLDWTSAALTAAYPMAKTAYDPASAQTYLLGDANGDGLIDPADASLILSANADGTYSILRKSASDVNGDGLIDPVDASLILSYNAYISSNGSGSLENYIKTL